MCCNRLVTTETQVVLRPLSRTQIATRRRILDAARDLAAEGGYDEVTMRKVAERAGVSAPTAYQYFSSKDHLLVDVMVDRVTTTTTALQGRPSRAAAPVDRAVATLRRAVRQVEEQPTLYVALTRAYISGAPEVAHARGAMETSMSSWIDSALGSVEIDGRAAVVAILESVIFASMVGLVTGRREPHEVGDELERAARTLLEGRIHDRTR
jgi:AcrR family transcriptional regulator